MNKVPFAKKYPGCYLQNVNSWKELLRKVNQNLEKKMFIRAKVDVTHWILSEKRIIITDVVKNVEELFVRKKSHSLLVFWFAKAIIVISKYKRLLLLQFRNCE